MKLFGEGGFKGFLAHHAEKVLFLAAAVGAVMLILNGFGKRQALDTSKTPSSLRAKVQQTETHIDSFSWDSDYEKNRDHDQEFRKRAEETLKPISLDSYAINQDLRPPVSPPPGRRDDPILLPVVDLQVLAGYGALSKSSNFGRGRGRGMGQAGGAEPGDIFDPVENTDESRDLDSDKVRPINRTGGTGFGGGRRTFSAGDQPEGVYFVAITALVPIRQQFVNYQTALANANGIDFSRDVPTILNWELQRAVAPTDETEPKWETVATLEDVEGDSGNPGSSFRSGQGAEDTDDFDPRFRDPSLTMSVPNISTRNVGELVIHQKITQLTAELEAKEAEEAATESEDPRDRRDRRRQNPDGSRNRRQASMMDEFVDMPSGMGSPSGRGRFGQRQGSDLSGDMDPKDVPEYRMFRYVDREVTPGTSYVYRLRLIWDDPNHPVLAAPPAVDSLEPAVQIRITSIDRDAEGRATEFSEPSEVVRVREGAIMLVGDVTAPDQSVIRNGNESFRIRGPYKEPVATAMAMEFDKDRASDIPAQREVRRGWVGNFSAGEIWVPIFWKGNLYLEEPEFQMDNLVVDIAGGAEADPTILRKERDRPRPEAYAELLKAPGRMLVREASGQLRVRYELEDSEAFQEIASAVMEEEKVESRSPRGDDFEGLNEFERMEG